MPEYRRSLVRGGTYFFTVVTYDRLPIFSSQMARNLLYLALEDVNRRCPFITDAICLLPNHIHCIWTLPDSDIDFALRWGEIKKLFTKAYHKQVGFSQRPNASRMKRGEGTIWQRRFWEHTIRDQDDYHRHLDYIHYNPVKHGLVSSVVDWQWSSFHRYVEMGYYASNWGSIIERNQQGEKFGE